MMKVSKTQLRRMIQEEILKINEAYMNQDRKKDIAKKLKPILSKYGLKGTLSVRHHSTLVLKIKSGKVDFIGERDMDRWSASSRDDAYVDVNVYHYKRQFTGKALKALSEIIPAMNTGNHDKSDIQTDYFDVGWYIDVNIGDYNTPYVYTGR